MSAASRCALVCDLHDAAYDAWREWGVRGAVLVHVDAHLDAAPVPEDAPIDIGNFVRAALDTGIVSRVHWIVPEPFHRSAAGRRFVERQLGVPDPRVTATGFGSLPPLDDPVLLDIDVDYLALADPRRAGRDTLPWCWPEQLIEAIHRDGVRADIVTIASSVTGGFTPVLWKHLAGEIASRLAGDPDRDRLACYAELRAAAVEAASGRVEAAIAACRAAVTLRPGEAAGHYHLAGHLLMADRREEARAAFARALALDPSYRTPFRTRAPSHLRHGRWAAAKAACESAQVLDPGDPYARYGLGVVALHEGRIADARRALERTVADDPGSVEGWRAFGQALAAAGETRPAIAAYERALSLTLHGAVPASGPWFGSNVDRRIVDHLHGQDHAAIGQLQRKAGDLQAAKASLTIAAAFARDDLSC